MTPNSEHGDRFEEDDLGHPVDAGLVNIFRQKRQGRSPSGSRSTERSWLVRTAFDAGDANMGMLCEQYENIINSAYGDDGIPFQFSRYLGEGGQGVVRLTTCDGANGFTNSHLAVKFFSPSLYPDVSAYDTDMTRIAGVASLVAGIDHGNLINVQRFENLDGVRMMVMKQVSGYDLRRLMQPSSLQRLQSCDWERWEQVSKVIAQEGVSQARFRPGAAVAIVRSCLMALVKLHESGLVYGDLKPSNIMLTPDGEVKIVDIGSAYLWEESQAPCFCTPEYAAPEVLTSNVCTPQSDLASLGYVLIELLIGRPVFDRSASPGRHEQSVAQERSTGMPSKPDTELIRQKEELPTRLEELLPSYSSRLRRFLKRLVAFDPCDRFQLAIDADTDPDCGAYRYMQELADCKLTINFPHEYRLWLQSLLATH